MNLIKQISIFLALIYSSIAIAQISPEDLVDKIYIQTDKPMYLPGDNIWYNLTVYNAQNLPALLSDQVHIQLKKPDGSTLYEKKYNLTNGQVSESIQLKKDIPGGLYRFVVSTDWMNECEPLLVYEKEIYIQKYIAPRVLMKIDLNRESYGLGDEVVATFTAKDLKDNGLSYLEVQYGLYAEGKEIERLYAETNSEGMAILNVKIPRELNAQSLSMSAKVSHKSQIESIRKTIPLILDNIDIQFLAEGGFLLEGIENVLAFKAIASNGKPADVEGDIVDSKGSRVGGFLSVHDGMGQIYINPKAKEKYFAKLCKPYKSEKLIPIENIKSTGSKIEIEKISDDIIRIKILGEMNNNMSLVLSDISESKWESENVEVSNDVNIEGFSRGIYRVSLKNSVETLSERLVFLHPDRKLNIDVTLDNKSYGLRSTVNAMIKTTDSNGLPVPAQLCIAAVEDKVLSHADDKQPNLVSELLLSSELTGNIHEPNYYFDTINTETVAALDLLMLTNGWRSYFDSLELTQGLEYYRSMNSYIGQLVGRHSEKVGATTIFVVDYLGKSAYSIETDDDGYFSILREEGKHLSLTANVSSRQYFFREVNLNAIKKTAPLKYKKLQEKMGKKGMIGKVVLEEAPKDVAEVKTNLKEGILVDAVHIVAYTVPLIEMDHTTSGATVTAEAIRSLPTKSINAIAASTAGVSSTMDEISIRGSRSNSIVYYVDGVRVNGLIPQLVFNDDFDDDFDEEVESEHLSFRNNNYYASDRIITGNVASKRRIIPKKVKFYIPKYGQEEVQKRTDFRQTIYWNSMVQTDEKGEAKISFATSDEVTSFSIIVEGASIKGEIGTGLGKVVASKALNSDCKIPSYFVQGDTSVLRIVVDNDSNEDQIISVEVGNTGSLALNIIGEKEHNIDAKSSHVFYAQAIATGKKGGHLDIKISGGQDSDYVSQDFEVLSPYFPLYYSASGVDSDTFYHTLSEPIMTSIEVDYKTFNPISSALEGIESMLRSPGGCFEQVSSSTYPNVMVLQYLQKHNSGDSETKNKALKYIKDGYNRLADYETKVDGFDWWGRAPGHVALTAYGLLEFSDMMKVYDKVDKQMIMRTINYLLKKRDGKGGFVLSSGYDGFGSAVYDVQTAYVLYALSEQTIKKVSLDKEYNEAKQNAMNSKDLYLTGLMAMTAYNNGFTDDYKSFMKIIKHELRVKDLNSIASKSTITRSGERDNNTETIAICALAYMKSTDVEISEVSRLIDHISSKRKRGRFGSTQATCLSIQAVLKYADWQGQKSNEGKILATLNGVSISNDSQTNDVKLGTLVDGGEVTFSTNYTQSSMLNYSLDIAYESSLPPTSSNHSLDLSVSLSQSTCELADIVGMEIIMSNIEQRPLANPTLVIGIPSGLSMDHKQLKELKEDELFDYFEIFENRLIIYFNEISALDEKKVVLDLKAEIPGQYTAPPSKAYLYYDEENVIWQRGEKIEVKYKEENFE